MKRIDVDSREIEMFFEILNYIKINGMKNDNGKRELKTAASVRITRAIDLIKLVREEPEPIYLWKGVPEKSMGLITGVGKTGKTTFAENLGISIAVGKKEFFGENLEGVPRKVLFVNLEEGYKLRSRRNAKQIGRLNQEELELFEENYLTTPPEFLDYLNNEDDWEVLHQYIKKSGAEVVILDSLTHMCVGEIERSSVAQNFTQFIRRYLTVLDRTFIIIHHNTKGNEKPLEQDSIAGSRVILQEFEYAFGLGNIPTAEGGNYLCMLFNKHIEKDDTTAFLYTMDSDGWVRRIGVENKFDLYKENKSRQDWRTDSTNPDLILQYLQSQTSQDSPDFTSANLTLEFLKTKRMSKDTLYKSLDKLADAKAIERVGKGKYKLIRQSCGEEGE